jgi:uncharacterized protein YdeI (BOF family)
MRSLSTSILIGTALALVLPSCSDDAAQAGEAAPNGSAAAAAQNIAAGNVVSLRGRVIASQPSGFMLDYGSGRMLVEMDDWDWYQEGRAIKAGDEVIVTGQVDRDTFERSKIEASSVYVVNLGAYFYASGADEEDKGVSTTLLMPLGTSDVIGNVTAIEGSEVTIGHEGTSLRVDTAQMADSPLDDQGNLRVRVGDRVYAWGRLDVDPGEAGELMAQGLIVMRPDRTKTAAAANAAAPASGSKGGGQ